VNLDTTVEQLLSMLPTEVREDTLVNIPIDEVISLTGDDSVKSRELFYLDSPIDAIVRKRYLESCDPSKRLYELFNEPGEFWPYKPDGIRTINPDD